MRNSAGLLVAVVLLTVFVGVPGHIHGLQAAAEPRGPHHPEQETAGTPVAAMFEPHQGMMKMMSEMEASDAKLDALVQTMNAATEAAKTDAMAALLTALVAQHRAMHSSMASMMNTMNMMGTMNMMNNHGSHDQQPGSPKQ